MMRMMIIRGRITSSLTNTTTICNISTITIPRPSLSLRPLIMKKMMITSSSVPSSTSMLSLSSSPSLLVPSLWKTQCTTWTKLLSSSSSSSSSSSRTKKKTNVIKTNNTSNNIKRNNMKIVKKPLTIGRISSIHNSNNNNNNNMTTNISKLLRISHELLNLPSGSFIPPSRQQYKQKHHRYNNNNIHHHQLHNIRKIEDIFREFASIIRYIQQHPQRQLQLQIPNNHSFNNNNNIMNTIQQTLLNLWSKIENEENLLLINNNNNNNDNNKSINKNYYHQSTSIHNSNPKIQAYAIDTFARLGEAQLSERILRDMVRRYIDKQQQKQHSLRFSTNSNNGHGVNGGEFDKPHAALFGIVAGSHAKYECKIMVDGDDESVNSSSSSTGLTGVHRILAYQAYLYRLCLKNVVNDNDNTRENRKRYCDHLRLNERSLASLLNAYARRGDGVGAERALENAVAGIGIFSSHIHCNDDTNKDNNIKSSSIIPDARCYNAVIAAYARKAKVMATANNNNKERREQALSATENSERILNKAIMEGCADSVTFATVISSWSYCPIQPEGVRRADDILQSMEEGIKNAPASTKTSRDSDSNSDKMKSPVYPNAACYNAIIDAYGRIGDAARADTVLRRLLHLDVNAFSSSSSLTNNNGNDDSSSRYNLSPTFIDRNEQQQRGPDIRCLNIVLSAWARKGGLNAGRSAQNILESVVSSSLSSSSNIRPDVISYNTVLNAWGRSGIDEEYIQGAENLLGRMEIGNNCNDDDHTSLLPRPDTVSYNTIISAFARRNGKRRKKMIAVEKQHWQREEQQRRRRVGGKNTTFKKGTTWSKLSLNDAKRAEYWLRRMISLHLKPTFVSYGGCISAWAQSGAPGSANRTIDLLREMEGDNNNSGYGDDDDGKKYLSGDAVPNDSSIINGNEQDNRQRLQQKTTTKSNSQLSYYQSLSSSTHVAYAAAIGALANDPAVCGDDARRISLSLLQSMEKGQRKRSRTILLSGSSLPRGGNFNTIDAYNAAINTLGKSRNPNAVVEAESILIRLEDAMTVSKHRNGTITAGTTSKDIGVNEMNEHCSVTALPLPDLITYCSVIDTWCNYHIDPREGVLRGANVLERMVDSVMEEVNTGARPTKAVCNTTWTANRLSSWKRQQLLLRPNKKSIDVLRNAHIMVLRTCERARLISLRETKKSEGKKGRKEGSGDVATVARNVLHRLRMLS